MSEGPARILVVGATGELGHIAVTELLGRGARVALTGRNERSLVGLAARSGCPTRTLDARDLDACAASGPWARSVLGRLDGVLVTVGVGGFGHASAVPNAIAEQLMTVSLVWIGTSGSGSPAERVMTWASPTRHR
ncbi:SDR family NAD(P)-dependent oxidoreductase, partial [Streptomyces yangpuensis]|uniref:SDR family NAD(P)-dependent oxidoreductase n=1 Tax=Streptomyces yangpuensis TaxID=1648182 RepID=UPI0012FE8F19